MICPDSIAANVQSVELIPLNAGNQIERVMNAHGAFHTSTAVIVEYFWMTLWHVSTLAKTLSTAVHNKLCISFHDRETLHALAVWQLKTNFQPGCYQGSWIFRSMNSFFQCLTSPWSAPHLFTALDFEFEVTCSFKFFIRIVGSSRSLPFLWITSHSDLISTTCLRPNHVGQTLLLLSCKQG